MIFFLAEKLRQQGFCIIDKDEIASYIQAEFKPPKVYFQRIFA
jgi:hypothetical protein